LLPPPEEPPLELLLELLLEPPLEPPLPAVHWLYQGFEYVHVEATQQVGPVYPCPPH
jgi:hypothetical protein